MTVQVVMSPKVVPAVDSDALELGEFFRAHDLVPHIGMALLLGEKLLPPGTDHSVKLEQDPDCEGQWIVMDWSLRLPATEAVLAYKQFVTEWNANTPPWVGNFLRFTFHLV